MTTFHATVPVPVSNWTESQAQMLEDSWLLSVFTVLLATALPWFVSAFNIDFAAASWGIVLLGGVYVALAMVSHAGSQHPRLQRRALGALHAAGVIAIGLLWQRVGGLQNPAFLLAFVLPVFGASALSRWHPYATAALGVLVAAGVALSQAPELRWYASGLHVSVRWLLQWFGTQSQGTGADILPGFYAPVGYDVVLLEVLAVLLFACAVASESLANSFEKVLDHLLAARSDAARGQEMWAALLHELPLPAVLVEAESRQIVLASRYLAPFWPTGTQLAGQELFESIRFSYPERLQQALTGEGADLTLVAQSGPDLRLVRVRVQPFDQDGRRLALVLLEDATEAFCVAAALDAQEHATVVINARARIVAANRPAHALFPEAAPGADASRVLSRAEDASRWWEPGLTGRRRMHVTLLRRSYLTTCTAVPLPGENEALYVVAFTPLAANAALAGTLASIPR